MSNDFAIYIAERLLHEPNDKNDSWYHTFLMLVDQRTDPPTILQQLHYNDDINGKLEPNIRKGIAADEEGQDRYKDLMSSKVFEGSEEDVVRRWSYGLGYSLYVKTQEISFAEDYKHSEIGANCRSGVYYTLKAMSIETDQSNYAQSAGLSCTEFSLGVPFSEIKNKKSLRSDWDNVTNYIRILSANWILGERYVGPAPYPFKPIKK